MNNAVTRDELKRAISAAARWYALLQSPVVSPTDRHNWQAWLQEHPSHHLAWQQVEQIQGTVASVPGNVAAPALRGAALSRRDIARRLGMLAVAAPLGAAVWQFKPWQPGVWQRWQAQQVTAIGEQRTITLADGGTLLLNTATSLDIAYDDNTRTISLYQGEILVQTAPDTQQSARPFYVMTPQGRVQALGTRFVVRSDNDNTRVTVLEKAVRVSTAEGQQSDIHAGQQLAFTRSQIGAVTTAQGYHDSWASGSLVVVDMPLRDLLAELGRYRRGLLSCSDDIAGLKISGAFPIADTDRALTAITRAFPVQERRLTHYWVRLTKA